MKMYEWIRDLIQKTPGLTQKGLAHKMGLNPAAVNRMLYGQRKIAVDEVPVIESYLSAHYQENDPGYGANYRSSEDIYGSQSLPGQESKGAFDVSDVKNWLENQVPVYGQENGTGVLSIKQGEIIDWVIRHPSQKGITNAFAVYVPSETMSPRYYVGELIYIHPGRPPEIGKDCLIELKNGAVYILRYIGQNSSKVSGEQINPKKTMAWNMAEVQSIYSIVGRG